MSAPNGKPEYSDTTNIYQAIIGKGMNVTYANIPLQHCLSCGALVMDKAAHDEFHVRLHRSACRG